MTKEELHDRWLRAATEATAEGADALMVADAMMAVAAGFLAQEAGSSEAAARHRLGNLLRKVASNGACKSTSFRLENPMALIRNTIFVAALVASSAALAQSASKPTDPQIAHIAYTADEIDIKAGQLAKTNSKNPKVVAFAEVMIRDHTAVNEQALALLKKLNIEPEANEISRTLADQGEAQLQKLSSLKGADFDKAYMENEVAYHRLVNETLRTTLIPAASNAELKDLLSTGLKLFEGHQQHAEQLAKEIQ